MHAVARDKALFHVHCIEHGLPTVPIVCIVSAAVDARYHGIRCVTGIEEWLVAMTDAPHELFVKTVDGTFGEGAFPASRAGAIVRFAGREGSLVDFFVYLRDGLRDERGWLVQPRLRCHEALASIMSRGMGTVRTVTCMDAGRPKILYALLKITVGENAVDNFYHGSLGNLLARIDIESGRLYAARGSSSREWPTMADVTHHPDTGAAIEGFVVPHWRDIIHLVVEAQQTLPHLKTAGWDIAVTPDGPVLVETNAAYSMDILQVAYGRGLKGDLARHLGITGVL
jgi:hypothetical protein